MVGKSNYEQAVANGRISRGLPIDTSKTYSAEAAQALVARLLADPIPMVPGIVAGDAGWGPTTGAVGGGLRVLPGKAGYHIEDPRIEGQDNKPERPETRYVTGSTLGKVIPISFGKRRIEGNIIQASALNPKLVGNSTKYIEYEIPIYEDPPVDPDTGLTLENPGSDGGGIGDPTTTSCGSADPCSTRSTSDSYPTGGGGDGGGGDPGGGDGTDYYAGHTASGGSCCGAVSGIDDDLLAELRTSGPYDTYEEAEAAMTPLSGGDCSWVEIVTDGVSTVAGCI